MTTEKILGGGLVLGAAVFGFRAFQAYQQRGGAAVIVGTTSPVSPRVPVPQKSVSFDFLQSLGGIDGVLNGAGTPAPQNSGAGLGGLVSGITGLFSGLLDGFGGGGGGNGSTGGSSAPVTAPTAPVKVSKPKTPVRPVAGGTDHDRLTLARTIYGEARNQDRTGQEAVANVVLNRMNDPRYPDTAARVSLQPWQFSAWNKNDPNRKMIKDQLPGRGNSKFDLAYQIAGDALAGRLKDNTGGATHYYANYIAEPNWVGKSPNAKRTAKHGVHLFYRGIL